MLFRDRINDIAQLLRAAIQVPIIISLYVEMMGLIGAGNTPMVGLTVLLQMPSSRLASKFPPRGFRIYSGAFFLF